MNSILKTIGTPTHMRELNRRTVLRLLRDLGPLSRTVLAERTTLSTTTMTNVVNNLLRDGLIIESPTASKQSKGRPQVLLQINSQFGIVIGMEVNGAGINAVISDYGGSVIGSKIVRYGTPSPTTDDVLDTLYCVLDTLLCEELSTSLPLRGIGVALQGLVDVPAGLAVSIPEGPSWRNVPLRRLLADRYKVPVLMDWRVYAAALAELRVGMGQHHEDFLYVNTGRGTAFSLVSGRTIVRRKAGVSGQAGQLGHLIVSPRGTHCFMCGNDGCLESEIGPWALCDKVRRAAQQRVDSILWRDARAVDDATIIDSILSSYVQGDALARYLVEDIALYLGIAIAHLLHLFNPALVIVGGDFASLDERFLADVTSSARRHSQPRAFNDATIVLSRLKPDSATMGAATLVIDAYLEGAVEPSAAPADNTKQSPGQVA